MVRWLVVLFLTVASATGWAQSTSGSLQDTTTRAWNASAAAEQALGRANRTWNDINTKFRVELDAVTRLKNSPKSWRRDRELRAKIADADALGRQLESASADVRRAAEQLAAARRTLVAAIDAELKANPGAPRKTQLDRARAQVAPQSRKATRIVLPDMQIDPLADPEELDQQAKAILDAETELANQLKGLEAQAKELERIAVLRKQHDRSNELDRRDDNNARKGATPTTARGGVSGSLEDAGNSPAPPNEPTGRPDVSSFEMDATITLADIVDPSTIEELNRAQRSNDPATRAAVARLTREAVAKKLQQLRDKRKQVENRAANLRKNR
jgi:hypothetical protein